MANNKNGFEYENLVIDCLKQTKTCGTIKEAAGASAWGPDANFIVNGNVYNLEIKLNSNAQMGGTSVKFENENFIMCNQIDKSLENLVMKNLNSRTKDFKKLLFFLESLENKQLSNFPVTCKTDSWEKARNMMLLINEKIPFDTDFICDHYAKKNTHYIQIGGSGFFYMKENPANLPIPKLKGNICVEIRTGRSGSRKNSMGEKTTTAGIRVQGRLKTNCKSPYTLDNVDHIKQLFNLTIAAQ